MRNGFYWYIPSTDDHGDWKNKQVVEIFANCKVYMTGSDYHYVINDAKGRFIGPLPDPENNSTKVECLACGWEGDEKDLDPNCQDDGFPIMKTPGCPVCKSLGWEHI